MAAASIVFAFVFDFLGDLRAYSSPYSLWINNLHLLELLLVGYPCACATSIRSGIGLDSGLPLGPGKQTGIEAMKWKVVEPVAVLMAVRHCTSGASCFTRSQLEVPGTQHRIA
ncbi:hypothetical protein C8034_v012108 [Colletotrichum sidae]|uniref:Uncharacterized protein n=1 Tax=Colletotrichum sidae TaxID=1347389 RepID=A0A4R8THP3_9PEZI|nr:hypothetical protein C8034_v012108 [Colletotrichum sidae]